MIFVSVMPGKTASRGPAATVPSVQDLGSNIPFQPPTNAIQQIRVNGFFNFGDNPNATLHPQQLHLER